MKIAGLDISKNAPGCVKLTLDDSTLDIKAVEFCGFTSVKKNEMSGINFFKKDDFNFDQDQFIKLEKIIFDFLKDVEFIALEDYAYGGSGDMTGLAEFTGFIKIKQFLDGKKIRKYDIPSIKAFATGHGNSDKLSMYNAFIKENEMKPDISKMPVVAKGSGVSPTSDIIDAYWISRFLQLELKLRKGLIPLKSLDEAKIKLFNRTTKAQPENLLATDFIEKR
jgi:hypothetical protein